MSRGIQAVSGARRCAGACCRPRRARGTLGLGREREDPGPDGPSAASAVAGRAAGIDPVPDLHQGRGRGNGEPHRRPPGEMGAGSGQGPQEGIVRAAGSGRSAQARSERGNCSPACSIVRAACRIQTIHAFAQSLLAAFPAEAGITPGFQPIEGRAEQELVRRTLADLMADAESDGDDSLICDVQCLSRRLGEMGAVEYLQACARAARGARCARTARRHRDESVSS